MSRAKSSWRARALAALGLAALFAPPAALAAEVPLETIDFEDQAPNCVVSQVQGDWGSGPIRVRGLSARLGPAQNAAVVVDTTDDPPELDRDLRTPSLGGLARTSNDRPLYNAVIISKRPTAGGYVASPDDEDSPGGKLRFDFSELVSGPDGRPGVTFHGLTLIDRDNGVVRIRLFKETAGEPFAQLESRPAAAAESSYGLSIVDRTDRFVVGKILRDPFVELEIQPTRIDNSVQRLDVSELRASGGEARGLLGEASPYPDGIHGVVRMEIELGGSGAVDEIRFRGRPRHAQGADERRERDLWEELNETLDVDREMKRFEKSWKKIQKEAEREGARNYDAEIALLDETRDDLLEKLECPGLVCGCPELRPLRAWVRNRFEQARASVEAAREGGQGLARPAAAGRGRGLATPANLRPGRASGFALVQSGEGDGGILAFIEIELWGPLKRVFGGESAGRVTVRLAVTGCDSYRFASNAEHSEKSSPRRRLCSEEAEIFIGLWDVGCSAGGGEWRPLGTFDLVKDATLVRDGRVALNCARTADLAGGTVGSPGPTRAPATSR